MTDDERRATKIALMGHRILQLATLSPHTQCPALTTDNHSTVCRGMLDTEQRGETFAGVIFRISSAPDADEMVFELR